MHWSIDKINAMKSFNCLQENDFFVHILHVFLISKCVAVLLTSYVISIATLHHLLPPTVWMCLVHEPSGAAHAGLKSGKHKYSQKMAFFFVFENFKLQLGGSNPPKSIKKNKVLRKKLTPRYPKTP